MALNEDFLLELKERNPIEDVVSSYVSIKKGGRNPKALCPFHNEKTPSFTLYPENGSFYCFGCGTGGDVIRFIRLIENLDYIDAVKFLAARAGMTVPLDEADDSLHKVKNRIYAINRETARFFNTVLFSDMGRAGYDYFRSRGLNDVDMKHFGLGFSPNRWDTLLKHLKEKGFSFEEMLMANVVSKGSRPNSYFDRFRNRIMFPIIDVRGNVIAFGGRKLPDSDDKAKYINTSDTPVYKKSHNVYALNFAKNSCADRMVLCEGYMDVIALQKAGIHNCIAPLGTAFTEEQAQLLSRYTKEVILCFDSDDAGQKAVERAIGILSKVGLPTKIIVVPTGKDPDEFIKSCGRDGTAKFKNLMDNALSVAEYRIERELKHTDISTDNGKIKFLESTARIISQVASPVEREVMSGRISEKYGVSKDAILSTAGDFSKKERRKQTAKQAKEIVRPQRDDLINREKPKNLRAANAEEGLLSVLLRNPDFVRMLLDKISPDDFVTSFNKKVFTVLCDRIKSGKSIDITTLNSDFSSEEIGRIVEISSKGAMRANTIEECHDCYVVMLEEKNRQTAQKKSFESDADFFAVMDKLKNEKVKGEK